MATIETHPTAKVMIDPKVTARHQLETLRNKLDLGWIQKNSEAIAQRLAEMPVFIKAKSVGCYIALPREVQTEPILRACWNAQKQVYVPACHEEKNRYEMCGFTAQESIRKGKWGISEPASPRWVSLRDIEIMIIPAVGFDIYGRRLGRGGGHFDQLLADHKGIKIALAFEYQKMTAVPEEPHDVAVNFMVTEKQVYQAIC